MEKNFTKGINVKTVATKYGDILKLGVCLEKFKNNPVKDGWINFELKKAKSGIWYAENQG